MRRRLLFLLCLPSILFLPLAVYVHSRPSLTDGTIANPNWVVARVVPGTPAARVGVQEGDQVVSWNGITDLGNAMAALIRAPEDTLHAVILEREGVRRTVTLRMERTWLPGERAANTVVLLAVLLFLIPGLLLWYAGNGSAPAEYAAALLLLAATPSMNPGNWNSLGPLLQVYPFHLGEVLYVLSNGSKPVIGFLLIIFANSVGRPILSSFWKAALGALMLVAILPPLLWAAWVFWGTVPGWLVPSFRWVLPYQVLSPLIALVLLFLQHRHVTDVNGRRRIRLLLAGAIPALLGSLLYNVVLILYIQWVHVIALVSILLTACFPAAVLYALLKHRLFDVGVIIRRGLQYALTTWSLSALAGIFLLVTVVMPLLEDFYRPLPELLSQTRVWIGLVGFVMVVSMVCASRSSAAL